MVQAFLLAGATGFLSGGRIVGGGEYLTCCSCNRYIEKGKASAVFGLPNGHRAGEWQMCRLCDEKGWGVGAGQRAL